MSDEYPLMLYRDGSEVADAWNRHSVDTLTVSDSDEHEVALAEGWRDAADYLKDKAPKADPFDHDGDGKPGGSKPKAKATA